MRASWYQVRGTLCSLSQSPLAGALLFFLVALCVRLHFSIAHPHFDNIFAVRGVPFSDAQQWTTGAILLTQGEGLRGVLRPGLSVALALFYTWFGCSFHTITALNIVAGSLTALFVFLIARTAFNGPIAIAAACFFVFDPSQVSQTPQASTEPLGLTFFTASVYCLLLVHEGGKLKPAILGGALMGLSNLARPLTLFCAPFYAGHLILSEWLRTRRLKQAIVPAIALCAGIVLTLSPWLIRQRLVHGVWSVSMNLGEALYGATLPKYKTWTSLVRADANRAGVEATSSARYKYFISESLKNIQRDPAFYAGQVARSYWQYLNCFDLKARSNDRAFSYRQWTGLVKAQELFVWITAGLLVVAGVHAWMRSGMVAGGLFLLISAALFTVWRLTPYAGVFILVAGMATSFLQCRWRDIAVLSWSLAITGLGDALFNNAILYRAVLMTDWIFSLFYLAAFYFSATIITNAALRILRKTPDRRLPEASARIVDPLVCAFEDRSKTIVKGVAIVLVLFVLAGSVRLLAVNFGAITSSRSPSYRLSTSEKREVIERLRDASPAIQQVLPDPKMENVEFIEPPPPLTAPLAATGQDTDITRGPSSAIISQVVVQCEPLSFFVHYFPRGTEFQKRDPLFFKRSFDCSIFQSAQCTVVFPGRIPRSLLGQTVVLVGWIEGIHPGWARPRRGEVMQCIALIPVLGNREFDYKHAVIVKPRSTGILPAKKR
jgi:4-amino-4-deoxy-L-arabinose transferase-like glycosyltransferase